MRLQVRCPPEARLKAENSVKVAQSQGHWQRGLTVCCSPWMLLWHGGPPEPGQRGMKGLERRVGRKRQKEGKAVAAMSWVTKPWKFNSFISTPSPWSHPSGRLNRGRGVKIGGEGHWESFGIWPPCFFSFYCLLPCRAGEYKTDCGWFFPSKKRLASKFDVPIILVFQAYLGGSSQYGKNKEQVRGTNIRKEDVNLSLFVSDYSA